MSKNVNNSRRKFIIGAAMIPAVNIAGPARAQDLPLLPESDAMAVALGYKEDASDADAIRLTKPDGANQYCDNCVLYTGAADAETGPCALFPGKAVTAKGWCNVWAARPA